MTYPPSSALRSEGGVVVDYIGDEIFAMFGAPEPRKDHAGAACRAGLGMLESLAEIDQRWKDRIGAPTAIGVGINTGLARAGNIGSKSRFKFGALGHTVNLASRVQGANKYLKTQALVTEATRAALTEPQVLRRLCQVEVVNIKAPVGLHELTGRTDAPWTKMKDAYEQALTAFEQGQARTAARILGNILEESPDDGPTLRLLARAVEAMSDAGTASPVWVLPGK